MKLNKLYMLTLTSKSTSESFTHIFYLPSNSSSLCFLWHISSVGSRFGSRSVWTHHICIMVTSLGKGEICFRISFWASLVIIIKREKGCWKNIWIVHITKGNIPEKRFTLESLKYQNQRLDDSGLALSASVFYFFWSSTSFIPVSLTTSSCVRGFSYQQLGTDTYILVKRSLAPTSVKKFLGKGSDYSSLGYMLNPG